MKKPNQKNYQFEISPILSSLDIVSRIHGTRKNHAEIQANINNARNGKVSIAEVLLFSRAFGLISKIKHVDIGSLNKLPLPALALVDDSRWVILAQADNTKVLIQDASSQTNSTPKVKSIASFSESYSGAILLLRAKEKEQQTLHYGVSWFLSYLEKYRSLLIEVFLISLALQILGLISPLFFQVVTDKILAHKAVSTLDAVVIGLVIVIFFESVFSLLRSYIFGHTTNKIDAELASALFKRLISLPLAYFENRKAGDSVARMRELETLREFLTGHALTLILDAIFSVVFLAVMYYYSPALTALVGISIPFYIVLTIVVVPILRRRLRAKYEKNASNQSMLIETISGIQTIKSSNLEGKFFTEWDGKIAAYLSSSFSVAVLSNLAQEGVSIITKLTAAGLLWLGAHKVMSGDLTIGMFVAFNMLSQRLTQPLIRIAQLWSDFQQVGISIERLSEILRFPPENSEEKPVLPKLNGTIKFENVTFRYSNVARPALENVCIDIPAGQLVAFVGRSGSGKSTLTKLLQRMYLIDKGMITIDGFDINNVDLKSFRRQIGIVLQDNFLFARSIRDNIAIGDPTASLERIIKSAEVAGAHDFIVKMPNGYGTLVGEHGVGLSGGQRQRIAIARALLTNPKILIFDEATSALDYESEAIIQKNMNKISENRTVIIVAHRLSTIHKAERIFVLDEGRVVEQGKHSDLIERMGIYSQLWSMQSGGINDKEPPTMNLNYSSL
jgi:subfamily B ATP-binding cassette protein HlyB/CyaB